MSASNLDLSVAAYAENIDAYTGWAATRTMLTQSVRFLRRLPADGLILDVGCGTGRDLDTFAQLGRSAVGLDLSPAMAAACRSRGHSVVVGDMRALPYASASLSGVWACASMVHLDPGQAEQALTELARVSRPHGRLYASVKQGGDVGGWEDAGHGGRRWFQFWGLGTFTAAAERCGWRVALSEVVSGSRSPWIDLYATRRTEST